MQKLFEFIRSVYVAVLFILFEVLALNHYAQSNAYTQARLLTRSNQVVGGVQGLFTRVRHFCSLGSENRRLSERIISLEEELARYRAAENEGRLEVLADAADTLPYFYTTAQVTASSINRSRHFIVIDRGAKEGVESDMALLAANGAMAGYIVSVSKNYAVRFRSSAPISRPAASCATIRPTTARCAGRGPTAAT